MPKRARFIFFLRALHKMTDICNFLDGSIPVNLEREVLIYVNQNAQARPFAQGSNLFRYSAGKRNTVELFDDIVNWKSNCEKSFAYGFHANTQNNWPKTECSWKVLCMAE